MLKKLVNTWGTSWICFETYKAYDTLVGHSLVSDTMLYRLLTLSILRRSLKHQGCIRHVMFDNSTEHTQRNSQLTRESQGYVHCSNHKIYDVAGQVFIYVAYS